MSYLHRIRVAYTVPISNEALRAFWAFHNHHIEGQPFSIRRATQLFREQAQRTPEIDVQIEEGRKILAEEGK